MNSILRSFALVAIFLSAFNFAQASHIAGADISYQCLGNDSFLISLNIFRDCFGISADPTETVQISNGCLGSSQNLTLSLVNPGGTEISQLCSEDSLQSTCNGGALPGIERYTYQEIYVLNSQCNNWTVSWESCCRNAAVVNVTGANSAGLYVESTIDNTLNTCNNSPFFTAQPIPYICAGQPLTYNFGVTETDGDSLVYSLIAAREDNAGTPQDLGYDVPYTADEPIPGAVMDSASGILSFTPTTLGNFVFVVLVEEYDVNGNLLGTVMRDIQFVVLNCPNTVPNQADGVITNIVGNATQLSDYSIELCDGENFSFDISVSDPDLGDSITFTSNLEQVFPGATMTQVHGNPATASIFIPTTGGNLNFNSFVIYADDNGCSISGIQTYVYEVHINKSTVAGEDAFIICGDQGAALSVEGGNTFTWTVISGDPMNVGTNFDCDTCQYPTATPDSTTVYEVASDLTTIGCQNKDTVTVTVVPEFGFTTTQTDTFVCLFGSSTFEVTVDSAGTYDYDWFPTSFFDADDTTHIAEATVSEVDTTDVIFIVSSDLGCVKTDTFMVVASANVQPVTIVEGDTTICIGDSTQILANIITAGTGMSDDFNAGINMAGWANNTGAPGQGCSSVDGDALYFNNPNTEDRVAETVDLSLPVGGFINFAIQISDGGAAPCEGVDNGDEIFLEYSVDGGNTWVEIIEFDINAYPTFTDVSIPIPDGAIGTSTRFRWIQPNFSGADFDNWAIDNVDIMPFSGDFTFNWDAGGSWISDSTIASPWIHPQSDTTYTVVVLDTLGGCTDTASISVKLVPTFTSTLFHPDSTSCLLDSLEMAVIPDSVGTYTYLWEADGAVVLNDTLDSTWVFYAEPGVITANVSITNSFGCTKFEEFIVTVSENVKPALVIATDTTVCLGDSVQLLVENKPDIQCKYVIDMFDSFGDGWNGAFLEFYVNDTLAGTFTIGGFIESFATDTVFVTSGDSIEIVFTSGGFPSEELFTVYDGEGNIILQEGPSPANGSIYTGAANCGFTSGGIQYSWTPNLGLSDDSISNPYVVPTMDTTTYTVTALDTVGNCMDMASINIYRVDSFSLSSTLSDTAICLFGYFEMEVTPSNSSSTYTYEWSPTTFINDPVDSSYAMVDTVSTADTLVYEVEVGNLVGCEKRERFEVIVSPGAQPDITIFGDSTVCEGDSTLLGVLIATNTVLSCPYTLKMYDGFGDGWEGGFIEVIMDGVVTDTLMPDPPIGDGDSAIVDIIVSEGSTLDLRFNPGGSLQEVTYQLYDNNGDEIFADGPNPSSGIVFSTVGNCGTQISDTYVYNWSPSGSLTNTSYITPANDLTVTLTVIDSIGGCGDTATYDLFVVENFATSFTATDTAICKGGDVTFTVIPDSAHYTYEWERLFISDTTLSTVTAQNITLCDSVHFNYTVTSPAGCGKRSAASVFVSSGITPNINISDRDICVGSNTFLSLDLVNTNTEQDSCGINIRLYDTGGDGWFGDVLTVNVNGDETNITLNNGTDSIVFMRFGLCDSVTFTYTPGLFSTEVAYSVFNEQGDSVLDLGGGFFGTVPPVGTFSGHSMCGNSRVTYDYEWTPGTFLSDSTIVNPSSTPSEDITYQIVVWDTIGFCYDTAQVSVSLVDFPVVDISDPGGFCDQDLADTLMSTPTGGTWSGNGIINSTLGVFDPQLAGPGDQSITYAVADTVIAECISDTTFIISVTEVPAAPIVITSSPYCKAASLDNFTGQGTGLGTLTWYEVDQQTVLATGVNPDLGIAKEDATFFVNETVNGCVGPFGSTSIEVLEHPTVSFTASPESGIIPIDVAFTNNSDDSLTYEWDFGDGTTSSEQHPSNVDYTIEGSYTVVLHGTDTNGCMSSDTLIILAENVTQITIPIVFTPNGDGVNDEFEVSAIAVTDFTAVIYNRWGTKVYEFASLNDSWNGDNNSDGTYFVVITYTDTNGNPQTYNGELTLIRD